MSRYVMDASVLIQYFIVQTYTPQAKALIERLAEGINCMFQNFVCWSVPTFFGKKFAFVECLNGKQSA